MDVFAHLKMVYLLWYINDVLYIDQIGIWLVYVIDIIYVIDIWYYIIITYIYDIWYM